MFAGVQWGGGDGHVSAAGEQWSGVQGRLAVAVVLGQGERGWCPREQGGC